MIAPRDPRPGLNDFGDALLATLESPEFHSEFVADELMPAPQPDECPRLRTEQAPHISLLRLRQLATSPSRMSEREHRHLETCPLCCFAHERIQAEIEHPTEEAIGAFVAGRLLPERAEQIRTHLDCGCDQCRPHAVRLRWEAASRNVRQALPDLRDGLMAAVAALAPLPPRHRVLAFGSGADAPARKRLEFADPAATGSWDGRVLYFAHEAWTPGTLVRFDFIDQQGEVHRYLFGMLREGWRPAEVSVGTEGVDVELLTARAVAVPHPAVHRTWVPALRAAFEGDREDPEARSGWRLWACGILAEGMADGTADGTGLTELISEILNVSLQPVH